MANDPILHLLGLAKKAGRLEVGEEPVGALCRARQAKLVLLAADAAPNTCRRAAHFGQAGNVLWLALPFSKAELGLALGRSSWCHGRPGRFGLCRLHPGEAGRPRSGKIRPRRPADPGEGRPGPPASAGKAAAREKPAGGQTKALGPASQEGGGPPCPRQEKSWTQGSPRGERAPFGQDRRPPD